jgi:hypothetical protein
MNKAAYVLLWRIFGLFYRRNFRDGYVILPVGLLVAASVGGTSAMPQVTD